LGNSRDELNTGRLPLKSLAFFGGPGTVPAGRSAQHVGDEGRQYIGVAEIFIVFLAIMINI